MLPEAQTSRACLVPSCIPFCPGYKVGRRPLRLQDTWKVLMGVSCLHPPHLHLTWLQPRGVWAALALWAHGSIIIEVSESPNAVKMWSKYTLEGFPEPAGQLRQAGLELVLEANVAPGKQFCLLLPCRWLCRSSNSNTSLERFPVHLDRCVPTWWAAGTAPHYLKSALGVPDWGFEAGRPGFSSGG